MEESTDEEIFPSQSRNQKSQMRSVTKKTIKKSIEIIESEDPSADEGISATPARKRDANASSSEIGKISTEKKKQEQV